MDGFIDDVAPGHGGTNLDNHLKEYDPPVHRGRIQGGTTGYIQPADTSKANQTFKSTRFFGEKTLVGIITSEVSFHWKLKRKNNMKRKCSQRIF